MHSDSGCKTWSLDAKPSSEIYKMKLFSLYFFQVISVKVQWECCYQVKTNQANAIQLVLD